MAEPKALSVSELTEQIKGTLANRFSSLWVSGEISDFSRPQSGHCYFTLKDDRSQIRAVLWRSAAARVPFELRDGMEVLCQGSIDVYPPRGTYQLSVEQIQPKGMGARELALRQLKDRLGREGLFDRARKRGLPKFPRRIAVITSPTGAAIRDFLEVLRRRWRSVEIWIVPVRVQGESAAQEIAGAFARINRLVSIAGNMLDAVVLARGGGSTDDLACFNDEMLVRAIHASRIPVVSAVGHDIDVTLADLVADVRALTPSEAAELVVPAVAEIEAGLAAIGKRLATLAEHRITRARAALEALAQRSAFKRPYDRLHELSRRLDETSARARRAVVARCAAARSELQELAAKLESMSPLGVLARGYSLTQRAENGELIERAEQLATGDRISTRFAQGRVISRVEEVSHDD